MREALHAELAEQQAADRNGVDRGEGRDLGRGGKAASWAWRFTIAGILLFSGSLYVLAYTQVKWLGAVTPFGGLSFMLGWICLAVAKWRE